MREFFVKLFSYTGEEGNTIIELFSVWHFLYLFLIIGGTIATAVLIRKKSEKFKRTFLTVIAIIIPILYLSDIFVQALCYDFFTLIDKLPFHICTILAIFIPFVHFNKKFEPIKEVIGCLAIVSCLMYMTYPGSALGEAPWSYGIMQTFAYHGLVFAWGFLSVSTGAIKLQFKNIWKVFVALAVMVAWAFLGNTLYSSAEHHYDWFFVTGSTFPFIPQWLMPFAVVVAVFGVAACVYGIDLATRKIIAKCAAKKAVVAEPSVAETQEKAESEEKKEEVVEEKKPAKKTTKRTQSSTSKTASKPAAKKSAKKETK